MFAKALKIDGFGMVDWTGMVRKREVSLYLPGQTGKSFETGSLMTPTTAIFIIFIVNFQCVTRQSVFMFSLLAPI